MAAKDARKGRVAPAAAASRSEGERSSVTTAAPPAAAARPTERAAAAPAARPTPPRPPPPPPPRASVPATRTAAPAARAAVPPARATPPALPVPAAAARATPARAPAPVALIEAFEGEEEHRHFPRARVGVPFDVWIGEGDDRRFSARLTSANVSVSGAFLQSSFFLPLGTELSLRFSLEAGAEPVLASGVIVREERSDPRAPDARTGFGVRFSEFYGQTDVSLARLFLGARLKAFAEDYLQSRRARGLTSEVDRVVDALAAWELLKATSPGDPWRGT